MATKAKELKIKVDGAQASSSGLYSDGRIVYSLCTPTKSNMTQQCVSWKTCRDYVHDAIRCHVHQKCIESGSNGYYPGKNPPMDLKRVRMLVSAKPATVGSAVEWWENFKIGLYIGKRIINFYEREYGFLTQTRITEIYHPKMPRCWMLIGPAEWMNNPHLLSAFTLMLRVGTSHASRASKLKKFKSNYRFETNEDVAAFFKFVLDTGVYDATILKNCKNNIHLLMAHRAEIFKDHDTKSLYTKKIGYSFHSQGGIQSMCLYRGSCEDANSRFKNIVNESI